MQTADFVLLLLSWHLWLLAVIWLVVITELVPLKSGWFDGIDDTAVVLLASGQLCGSLSRHKPRYVGKLYRPSSFSRAPEQVVVQRRVAVVAKALVLSVGRRAGVYGLLLRAGRLATTVLAQLAAKLAHSARACPTVRKTVVSPALRCVEKPLREAS